MAGGGLGNLTVFLGLDAAQFTTGMDKAKKQAYDFGYAIGTGIRKSAEVAAKALGSLGVAGVGAMSVFVARAVTAGAEISRFSELANASVADFQRMAAASQTVGISQDKLADQLKDFNEKVGEFQQTGGGGMKDFFEQIAPRIDITADAFRNLSGPEALQLYYNSLEKAGLGQKEMSFYLESMASDTTALIPLLRDGGKGFQELGDRAQRLGAILGDDAVAASKKLRDDLELLDKVTVGLAAQISGPGISALTQLAQYLLKVAETEGTARASLISFGKVVAGITGSDEFGQLQQRAKAAQDNLTRLTDMAERYQTAIDRGDNVEKNQRNLDRIRQRIASVSQEASSASEALKQFAGAADGSKPSVSAPNTGSGNFLDKYLADRRSDSAKMNAELSAEKVAFESATQGLVKGSAEYTAAMEAYNRKAADIRKKYAKGGASDDATSKRLDNELKAIESIYKREEDLLRDYNKMLDLVNGENLISFQDYYAGRRAAAEEALRNQTALLDQEIAKLEAYKTATNKATEREAAQGKINDLLERRTRLQRDAATESVALEFESRKAYDGLQRSINGVNASILEMIGLNGQAAAIRFDDANKDLRARLVAQKDGGAIAQLDQLRRLTVAQADFNQKQTENSDILARLQMQEDRINLSRNLGAIGELEGLQQATEARRAVVKQMEAQVLALEAIARASGNEDPRLVIQAEQARAALDRLNAESNLVAQRFDTIFSDAGSSAFADWISGAKSAKQAFADFSSSVISQISRMVAQEAFASLFGGKGLLGSGGSTGFFGDLFGSLFGGGRAVGGYVSPGKMYEVNENGSELLEQGGRTYLMTGGRGGRIVPNSQAFGGGGGFNQVNNFTVPGRIDRRTQSQIADQTRRSTNTAVARLG